MPSKGRSSWKRQAADFKRQLGGIGKGRFDPLDNAFGREAMRRADRDAMHEAERREKACTSKNRYDTEGEALEAIEACMRHGRRNLRHYRCPYCDGWHLTSRPQQ